jgi:hypothetical protein
MISFRQVQGHRGKTDRYWLVEVLDCSIRGELFHHSADLDPSIRPGNNG